MRFVNILLVLLCCAPSVAVSQETNPMKPSLKDQRPPGGTITEGPRAGIYIVRCILGSMEVTIDNNTTRMLLDARVHSMGNVYSQGERWGIGIVYRNRDDTVCPAIMTSGVGNRQVQYCISPTGVVYVPFEAMRVGDCRICNASGSCTALQVATGE